MPLSQFPSVFSSASPPPRLSLLGREATLPARSQANHRRKISGTASHWRRARCRSPRSRKFPWPTKPGSCRHVTQRVEPRKPLGLGRLRGSAAAVGVLIAPRWLLASPPRLGGFRGWLPRHPFHAALPRWKRFCSRGDGSSVRPAVP